MYVKDQLTTTRDERSTPHKSQKHGCRGTGGGRRGMYCCKVQEGNGHRVCVKVSISTGKLCLYGKINYLIPVRNIYTVLTYSLHAPEDTCSCNVRNIYWFSICPVSKQSKCIFTYLPGTCKIIWLQTALTSYSQ